MVKRFIIAILALVLIGGGLVGFNLFRDKMIRDIFANLPVQVLPVTTVTVQPVTWQPVIEGIGTANAGQGVDLTVEAAGIVHEVAFTPNQKVQAGDLLLRLDDVTQVADLESAQTQLDLTQTALNRARQLRGRGVATDAAYEAAEANFRTAEATLARARAALQTRRLAAPFTGTIGLPRVDPGAYITPGTVVATLQDLDRMRVDFTLPEQELPHLHIGQTITISSDQGDDSLTGVISGIDPKIDSASRMVAIRGEVEGTAGRLTPGQFVQISVALPVEENAIALPQTAIVSSLYGDYVYRLHKLDETNEDGSPQFEVRQVFIQPGRRAAGLIETLGDALAPGDQIVTSGQNRLSNGARITVDNSVTPDGQGQTPPAEPTADPAPEASQ